MWLLNFSICLFKGHDCSELTRTGKVFTYCHRCGRVKEERPAGTDAARRDVNVTAARPIAVMMPIDKLWR